MNAAASHHIRTATLNGVATIEIARPEKKNAFTVEMYASMAAALTSADADSAVRSVLIVGQPGIFSSGNDIDDFMGRPPSTPDAPLFVFMRALVNCRKPVLAAVTGAAIGIGTTMLLHCDLVYVSDEARLAMPFTGLGLVPEFAATLIVPALVGQAKASEKLLLGDPFNAEEAVEMRMANAVLPAGEVVRHARRMAERFNGLPPASVRATKELLRRCSRARVLEAIDAEAAVFRERLSSPEAGEAFTAFFQQRTPDFSAFS